MIIKECLSCKVTKPEIEFNVYHGIVGKQCKKCRKYFNDRWKNNYDYRETRKKYYRENKERHRARGFKNSILKKYGISVELYEKMFKDQSGQCAICKTLFTSTHKREDVNRNPCVDHCHRTNKVRALLCRKCNVSLGYVESGFVDKAIVYLRVHEMKDKEPS